MEIKRKVPAWPKPPVNSDANPVRRDRVVQTLKSSRPRKAKKEVSAGAVKA